jgi:uncharacterized protein YjbJ (UPF0337 family)
MDNDRIEGTVRNLAGRAEEAVGTVTGDHDREVHGAARRIAGQAQQSVGHAADEARDYVKDQPLTALLIAGGVGFLLGALIVRR